MVDPNGMDSGAFQEINRELNTPEGFLPDVAGMIAQGVQTGVALLTSGASGVLAKTTEPGNMGFQTDLETQDELADAAAQTLFQERRGEASFLEAAGRVGWTASQIGALPEIDPGDLDKILAEEWAYPRFGDAAVGDQAAKAGDPRGNADLEFTFSILPTALEAGLAKGLIPARAPLAPLSDEALANARFSGLPRFPKKTPTSKPLRAGEVTTYKDFRARSVIGDQLEGHELWQHANQNQLGLAESRLSSAASQQNPVLVLERLTHQRVNAAQAGLDARAMTPRQNIRANAQILRELKAATVKAIDAAEKAALQLARRLGF
jgi:hypothetical protein